MKMVMFMFFSAVDTKGKVLLTIIAHYLVYNFVFAKPVEHPVNGGPVHTAGQLLLYHVMT